MDVKYRTKVIPAIRTSAFPHLMRKKEHEWEKNNSYFLKIEGWWTKMAKREKNRPCGPAYVPAYSSPWGPLHAAAGFAQSPATMQQTKVQLLC